jgi:hypothetical protein
VAIIEVRKLFLLPLELSLSVRVDCRGAAIRHLPCRVCRRPSGTTFTVERSAASIAFDVHLQNGGVMDEAIDGGERHSLVGEDLAPCPEWLIGSDQHRASLVAAADQLEQHAGFGLILADIGDVVEDQQVILVELGEHAFESEFAARDCRLRSTPLPELC